MRIALLINHAPKKLGSLEDWLQRFAEDLQRHGHRLDVFGMEPIHECVLGSLRRAGAGWFPVSRLTRHALSGIRRLARDYDVLHLDFVAPRSKLAMLAYAAWPARVLLVDRSSGVNEHVSRPLTRRLLDRITPLRLTGIAGVSDYVRDRASERFGVCQPFARTIYDGVDVTRFTPPSVMPGPRDPRQRVTILSVAHLIPEKGIQHLIQAAALLQAGSFELQIVGDGPFGHELRALSERLGLSECVHFLGLRDDVQRLCREAEIFVHPATWGEAFGLTVMEAMSAGRAVVASRTGAIPELIVHGESGVLVAPGDPRVLADALRPLLSDAGKRASLGAAARNRAVECFSLARCVTEHRGWCEESVSRSAGRDTRWSRFSFAARERVGDGRSGSPRVEY